MALLLRVLLVALGAAVAGEVHINPLSGPTGFSLSTVVFYLAVLFWDDLPVGLTATCSVVGSILLKIALFFFAQSSPSISALIGQGIASAVYFFGTWFFMNITEFREQRSLVLNLVTGTMLLDTIASSFELLCRVDHQYLSPAYPMLASVLFVVLFRSTLIVTIYYSVQRERLDVTLRSEKANSEQTLMLLTGFYTEAFFLRKSSSDIESTMARCYELYRALQKNQAEIAGGVQLSQQALEVAKDIHEIKKDYQRIISGMDRLIKLDQIGDQMAFHDLVHVILASNQSYSVQLKKQIKFSYKQQYRFRTSEFHSVISILNNLVSNAVEAIDHDHGEIEISTQIVGWHIFIYVKDNGPGIEEADQKIIFAPGYTTKFSGTGQQSTGIGLTHVRSLVTGLGGEVMVTSVPGETIFTVILPRERIEYTLLPVEIPSPGAGDSQSTFKE